MSPPFLQRRGNGSAPLPLANPTFSSSKLPQRCFVDNQSRSHTALVISVTCDAEKSTRRARNKKKKRRYIRPTPDPAHAAHGTFVCPEHLKRAARRARKQKVSGRVKMLRSTMLREKKIEVSRRMTPTYVARALLNWPALKCRRIWLGQATAASLGAAGSL